MPSPPSAWLQAHPPIKLKKPQYLRLDKMAAKAMGGVGSAAKSVRRAVARKGSGTGLAGQGEVEARIVYVSTHAEGVTRVALPLPPPPLRRRRRISLLLRVQSVSDRSMQSACDFSCRLAVLSGALPHCSTATSQNQPIDVVSRMPRLAASSPVG